MLVILQENLQEGKQYQNVSEVTELLNYFSSNRNKQMLKAVELKHVKYP